MEGDKGRDMLGKHK